ncbi:MAG: glycosyltransferase [Negativicutes bacterium]|nr:glycosyltransferase [Negativicutes bacterium]
MFFSYVVSVVLVSLALYGLWHLLRDLWAACFAAGLAQLLRASLLLVVRNNEEEIEGIVRALLSEMSEEGFWVELVIVDHASEDITPAIIDRLADYYPQIKAVHLPAAARPAVEGIAFCRGEMVCLLDLTGRLRSEDLATAVRWFRQL